MDKIITISRQNGSGGREIGKKLADKLGIAFYDNELISRAAKESGFSEKAFEDAEKKATNSLLYSIAMGMSAYGSPDMGFPHLSLDDQLYLAQSNVILKTAKEGPCVIVGRCADYVLKNNENAVNIFIWADLEFRKKRMISIYGMEADKAAEKIVKADKRRANYYNYHTNLKWGRADNYHISLKSDFLGIEGTVACIQHFMEYGKGGFAADR